MFLKKFNIKIKIFFLKNYFFIKSYEKFDKFFKIRLEINIILKFLKNLNIFQFSIL